MNTLNAIMQGVSTASIFLVAIMNIYNFFAKPTSFFKKKLEEQEKARIKAVLNEVLPERLKEILNEVLPERFNERDLETRDKYLKDRQAYLKEISEEVAQQVSNDFGETIEEIKDINIRQNEVIQTLARSSRDMLREKIMAIYHKGKRTKSLALWEKEALEQYYIDYKAEDGNSYIDKYYNRMKTWAIIDADVNYDD